MDLQGFANIGNIMNKLQKDVFKLVKFNISAINKAATIKGLPNIAHVIRNGKADIRCNLATSYGNLNKESFKKMDKEMKVIIGYTIGSLSQLGAGMGWDSVIRCMNSNDLLKPKPGSSVHRTDGISKSGTGVFKTDGSASSGIVREVNSWFTRLVSDSDVMKDTGIDINVLGRMVAQTGASIDSFGSFFYKNSSTSKDVMDVSVLRFPDIDKPFFKVYRIRLRAWRKCERFLFVQKDRSGINGEYNSICYSPKPEVVARLNGKVIDDAVKEAEDLFS